MMVAEKIRRATSDTAVSVNGEGRKLEIPVSVSLGVATADSVLDSQIKALVSSADQALYQAKSKGRNTIVANRIP
jgi:diguanylate cyclase (GGDEF)-like protein